MFYFSTARQINVLNQLQLEEALFRADENNYCLAIHGSAPAIVMGAFGNRESLVHSSQAKTEQIPIIRRYSGGGTVVVDQDTLFLCFILNYGAFDFEPYPKEIMGWVYKCLRPLFAPWELLWVDNDFCLNVEGKLYKVAGNAQSITSKRIVHHISFPWSYEPKLMQLLKMPAQRPAYRENRAHTDFLYPLRNTELSPEVFIERLISNLKTYGDVEIKDYPLLQKHLERPHRKSTQLEIF